MLGFGGSSKKKNRNSTGTKKDVGKMARVVSAEGFAALSASVTSCQQLVYCVVLFAMVVVDPSPPFHKGQNRYDILPSETAALKLNMNTNAPLSSFASQMYERADV